MSQRLPEAGGTAARADTEQIGNVQCVDTPTEGPGRCAAKVASQEGRGRQRRHQRNQCQLCPKERCWPRPYGRQLRQQGHGRKARKGVQNKEEEERDEKEVQEQENKLQDQIAGLEKSINKLQAAAEEEDDDNDITPILEAKRQKKKKRLQE